MPPIWNGAEHRAHDRLAKEKAFFSGIVLKHTRQCCGGKKTRRRKDDEGPRDDRCESSCTLILRRGHLVNRA